MEISDQNIVALLGANGAGKSTLLKAICGLLSIEDGLVTDGTIEFAGKRIENGDAETVVKMGLSLVPEGRLLFPHFTVKEHLLIGAHTVSNRSVVKKDLDNVYTRFPRLKHLQNNVSGYLSGGEQQMVVIGSAMMAHPKMLLLDEPSMGLSPLLVQEIFDILGDVNRDEGTPILLVEQNAKVALNLANYGYVLENGRIVLDGPADKLRANEDVKEFYLGLSEVGEKKSYRDVKHYRRRKRWLM